MAILPSLKSLSVRITVNGKPCREWRDNDDHEAGHDDGKLVSKYIRAKSCAQFAIDFHFSKEYPYRSNSVKVEVSIDGQYMWNGVCSVKDLQAKSRISFSASGTHANKPEGAVRRPYIFSELAIEENIRASSIKPSEIAELGEIVVKVWRINLTHLAKESTTKPVSKKTLGSLPEKALKGRALSHTASLGDPIPVKKSTLWDYAYVDSEDTPLATYIFKYRSLEALKALCIIPRSPTPEPLEERPLESLSPSELRELVRKQNERLNAQSANIKRERSENIDDGGAVECVMARPKKSARISDGSADSAIDIVDLTSD